jgi:hypothetical protein
VLGPGALRNENRSVAHDDRKRDVEAVSRIGDQAGAPAAPSL